MAGRLASLTRPVRLALYTRADGCDTCADTQAILDEVAGLSPHLSDERHDHPAGEVAPGVEHVPAIVVLRDVDGALVDHGVRLVGVENTCRWTGCDSAVRRAWLSADRPGSPPPTIRIASASEVSSWPTGAPTSRTP